MFAIVNPETLKQVCVWVGVEMAFDAKTHVIK